MKYLLIAIIVLISVPGCKKNEVENTALATVSVANAVVGGTFVRMNDNLRDSCASMNYKHFTLRAGNGSSIKVYSRSTPDAPYFNDQKDLENGGVYSLFLSGTPAAPESVFIKDVIPAYATDSIIRIRIVNLSSNSSALKVTLGTTNGIVKPAEFSDVAYKTVTAFKDFQFKTIIPQGDNRFVIRNIAGDSLTSYTLPATGTVSVRSSRFRNVTLVVKGVAGTTSGTSAFAVFPLPHY